jgi:signal peptidase I
MDAMRKKKMLTAPTTQQLESEIKRVRYKRQYRSVMKSTIYMLITVAAVAILVATLWLPVLQIYGNSMSPTMENGDIVFSMKSPDFDQGDVIAFYYNNKILVKRVIAGPADWVDITQEGSVYVNGVLLEESYIAEKAYGDTNIELPYQVPDGKVFVMGDHRSTSVDSRNTAVGCVAQEQVVGKIVFRVWPFEQFGAIS